MGKILFFLDFTIWLIVSVIFDLNAHQTFGMFLLFSVALLTIIILLNISIPETMKYGKIPVSEKSNKETIIAICADFLVFSIFAYSIETGDKIPLSLFVWLAWVAWGYYEVMAAVKSQGKN